MSRGGRHLRRAGRLLLGWAVGLVAGAWRLSCRRRVVDDPRPTLRAAAQPYIYALLHAHQVAAVLACDEPRLAAMVSRSADGELLVPALRLRGVLPVRGSSRSATADKGGRAALRALGAHLRAGTPALLAVDGPRGPRNKVHRGVLALARRARATIVPVVVVPSRRWVLRRTWDHLQLPRPGCRLTMAFAAPIEVGDTEEDSIVRQRVQDALVALEARYDPEPVTRGSGR